MRRRRGRRCRTAAERGRSGSWSSVGGVPLGNCRSCDLKTVA